MSPLPTPIRDARDNTAFVAFRLTGYGALEEAVLRGLRFYISKNKFSLNIGIRARNNGKFAHFTKLSFAFYKNAHLYLQKLNHNIILITALYSRALRPLFAIERFMLIYFGKLPKMQIIRYTMFIY